MTGAFSELIATTLLSNAQRCALVRLWNEEYPAQVALRDEDGLNSWLGSISTVTHYFAERGNEIVGWACTFDRENERWFAIIVDGNAQGTGVGGSLLDRLKEANDSLVGWAVDNEGYTRANGEHYTSPIPFYMHRGFHILNERLEIPSFSAVKISWAK